MCYAPHMVPNISQVDLLLHVVGKIVKRCGWTHVH